MSNFLATAAYKLAAHLPHQLPADTGREVAFAGRSNAGKSSALNALCNQHRLAKTSKTPGRTQQLVFFEVVPDRYLVDLPGYGYAKVPLGLKAHWQEFINGYFQHRQALSGLVIVMDIRHPLREFDLKMLDYARSRGLPAHCLLTKADKLGRGAQANTVLGVRKELGSIGSVQLISSETKRGIDEARAVVTTWLHG
jgi:GTP-binding protein